MTWTNLVLFIGIALAVGLKLLLKLSFRSNNCYKCLIGKTAVVTGATSGMGYITALDFAKRGCKVILACRNPTKANATVCNIKKLTGNENIHFKQLDLSCFKSIRGFVQNFNETEDKLDILVNNAGVVGVDNKFTDDGLLLILQTNYVGAFLLTHLLLDKLKASESGRIVNVGSFGGYLAGNMDLNELNKRPKDVSLYDFYFNLYQNTKLCNILFTIELAKRLKGTKVTANTLHPGFVDTGILVKFPFWKRVLQIIIKFYFKTSTEGAQTTIYVALSDDIQGVSGKLFENCRQIKMYPNATEEKARKLWEMSEKWCKLKENEKIVC